MLFGDKGRVPPQHSYPKWVKDYLGKHGERERLYEIEIKVIHVHI